MFYKLNNSPCTCRAFVCLRTLVVLVRSCLFVYMRVPTYVLLWKQTNKKASLEFVSGSVDEHISCRRAGRAGVFTNQWWTNSGLPASQTSLLLSGAPSTEQVGWAALISSAVLFIYFFPPTESHRGTCVCVWDAGMHGANPPLSSNAWTVSKTLLLLLFLSMLIRRGLGVGVRWVHRCNSRLTSQDS